MIDSWGYDLDSTFSLENVQKTAICHNNLPNIFWL